LRAIAYQLLGRLDEVDDAVQDTWLRYQSADLNRIENLGGWLATAVARICLNMLRSRAVRREEPFGVHVPDPIVAREGGVDPEQAALLADAVGLALQVILDTLTPAERLAFVLHDIFAMSFDEIAPLVGRSAMATRQMTSRARRRVQEMAPTPDADLRQQRDVVDAFFAASREGDFDALLVVLDPKVVVRADWGATPAGASREVHGAREVAEQALAYTRLAPSARPALVNGVAGIIAAPGGHLMAVMGFTIRGGKIVAIDILADPVRLRQLDLAVLGN
jgi:RNA polymerase sigma-70 factor (ECF subfamily)